MEITHKGPGHAEAMLTLATTQPDGGLLHQSWTVCECGLAGLRSRLGQPQQESLATREQVRATALAVLQVPGVMHRLEGEGF